MAEPNNEPNTAEGGNEQTFTQAEVDSIVAKRLAQTYPGGYNVRFSANGATRLYIGVERKKKKASGK